MWSVNTLINAYGKAGEWQASLDLLNSMRCAGAGAADGSPINNNNNNNSKARRPVQPDVVSFNAAITACERGGQWEKAVELLRSMQTATSGNSNNHPSSIIDSAAKDAGRRQNQPSNNSKGAAAKTTPRRSSVQPNYISYSSAILACERHEQWALAEELRQEMFLAKLKTPPRTTASLAAVRAMEQQQQQPRPKLAPPSVSSNTVGTTNSTTSSSSNVVAL